VSKSSNKPDAKHIPSFSFGVPVAAPIKPDVIHVPSFSAVTPSKASTFRVQ
jgi:hypothetical protein